MALRLEGRSHFCVVTIRLQKVTESWDWLFYFPKSQRSFTASLYASDVQSLPQPVAERDEDFWLMLTRSASFRVSDNRTLVFRLFTYETSLRE